MKDKSVKTRPILVPYYMNEFKCIGSSCEDSCCVGWRVNIDEEAYRKYKKTRDSEIKPLLDKNIKRQRSNATPLSYAKINMCEDGRCPLLSEENLCQIQIKMGESFLSNTCATYPRIINRINGVVEKSLTLSCPEAARLILLNPEGIEFYELEEAIDTRGYITKDISTESQKVNNKPDKYLWDLRIFTIKILQDRSYTIAERLIILGMFYQKLQKSIDEGDVSVIPSTIELFTKLRENRGIKESIDNIPVNLTIQMKLCKEILDYRLINGVTNNRYKECLKETADGIYFTEETTVEEVTKHYKNAFESYYEPFMSEHEYILENYLVNYVFKNLFPLEYKTLFDDFVMLVIHYSLIKLHLIGMSGLHKGLSIEQVIKLIQSFAKTIEHNNAYLMKILKLLKDSNLKTMAYMAILIKN